MKQALIIIDVQNDYFEGGRSELINPLGALSNIKKVLQHFRNQGFPIIHVQHINTREGATFFMPNTEGAAIHKELTPQENEYLVVKHAPNSFFETTLSDILKDEAITDVVMCGMMSHLCIDTTARAFKDFAIPVTLLADACTTKNLTWQGKIIPAETVHDVFMVALNGMFANVINTLEFVKQ